MHFMDTKSQVYYEFLLSQELFNVNPDFEDILYVFPN